MDLMTVSVDISKVAGGVLLAIVSKLAYDGSRWGAKKEETNQSVSSKCPEHGVVVLKLNNFLEGMAELKQFVPKVLNMLLDISERLSKIESKVMFTDAKIATITSVAKELKPLSCLIIDDSDDNIELTCRMLENSPDNNIKCFGANKISDAKKHLAQTVFNLVIIDYFLNNESGYDLYKYIIKTYPKIKCIICSAKNPKTIESDIANIFIERPFTTKEILEKIGNVL